MDRLIHSSSSSYFRATRIASPFVTTISQLLDLFKTSDLLVTERFSVFLSLSFPLSTPRQQDLKKSSLHNKYPNIFLILFTVAFTRLLSCPTLIKMSSLVKFSV